jgi:L-asparaginase II
MEMTCGPVGGEGDPKGGGCLKGAAVPLVTVTRNGEDDMQHLGFACLTDADGKCLWSLGDPHAKAFFRSSAKPLQALAMVASGAADAAGLDDADLAIICGSNLGGREQKDQVESILRKSGLGPEALGCGDGLGDMCSGKHAGMLTACRHLRLPLDSYLDPEHPWQRRMLDVLCDYCAINAAETRPAVDGCSAPTFSLPVYNMALGFARLARESHSGPGPAARLLRAMAENPGGHTGEPDLRAFVLSDRANGLVTKAGANGLVTKAGANGLVTKAGANGLVTKAGANGLVTKAGANGLVTKAGANGLQCAALPSLGLGFALKVIDGAVLPRWPVLIRALEQADLVTSETAAAMRLALWPKVETRRGLPAGSIRLDF